MAFTVLPSYHLKLPSWYNLLHFYFIIPSRSGPGCPGKNNSREKVKLLYLYNSLLGDLHARLHHIPLAKKYFEMAMEQTLSETEKRILKCKISAL